MDHDEKKLFDSLQEAREQVQAVMEKLFVVGGTEAKNVLIVKAKIQTAQEHLGSAFRELMSCQRILERDIPKKST